jgi:uncharacterized protein YbjT (DUF2867 family)
MKTALVFGATGQTGEHLTDLLLVDDRYTTVKLFVRKSTGKQHSKLVEIVNDLSDVSKIQNEIAGNDLFCCLGTTIKKAGSQEAFKKVDYYLPLAIAKAAKTNSVETMITMSSVGANAKSGNFYSKTKGEVEQDIAKVGIASTIFVRPSILLGKRKEFRLGERIGKAVFSLINPLFIGKLKRYKGIHSETVAKAMIHLANDTKTGTRHIENEELLEVGK